MSQTNSGMRAYSEVITVTTAAGLACASAVLTAIFAKNAIVHGSAKDAGIALSGVAITAGSGLAAWRSMKKLFGMVNNNEQVGSQASPTKLPDTVKDNTPTSP
jgi:hypothetical protein